MAAKEQTVSGGDERSDVGREAQHGALRSQLAAASKEPDPSAAGRLFQELAWRYERELKDADTAIACHMQALDLNPELLYSFQRVSELWVSRGDWRSVEEHHRRMLERLGTKTRPRVRAALWKNLGEVLYERLDRHDEGVLALETALRLGSRDEGLLQTLSAAYRTRQVPRRRLERLLQARVDAHPGEAEELRALFRLLREADDSDGAWWLAGVLVALGAATSDEEALYVNERRGEPPLPSAGQLDWLNRLRHPRHSALVDSLLAAALPRLYERNASSPQERGLRERDRVPADAPLLVNRCLAWLGRALGIPPEGLPPVYRSQRRGCRLVLSAPLALEVGQELFQGQTQRGLVRRLAPELALLSGGGLATRMFDEGQLTELLSVLLGEPEAGGRTKRSVPGLSELLDGQTLSSLPQIQAAVGDPGVSARQLAEAFREGVSATGRRVAALLSDDPLVALEGAGEELLAFVVSKELRVLRGQLGLSLEAPLEGLDEVPNDRAGVPEHLSGSDREG